MINLSVQWTVSDNLSVSKLNKLQKFEALKTLPNVLEFPENIKGRWHSDFFKNDNPIVLELACGKGDYTLAMSKLFPNKNFIGIDIKGARIWKGAVIADDQLLSNVCFLRIYIEQLTDYFKKEEVSEIWITFPDPFIKKSKIRKRLTSERFLNMYNELLPENGKVHLKTDSALLYEFTLESIRAKNVNINMMSADIYSGPAEKNELLKIQTYYERMHLKEGRKIHYVQFQFKA
jgi:tRNA (guanine-N7-)-methyltransferase